MTVVEYTHALLLPMPVDLTRQEMYDMSKALREQLPAHVQPLLIAGMGGNAVLIPLDPGAQP